jgi:RNA polymerase sigma factor (sigma-70 family)
VALVIGLAALTASAGEIEIVSGIQRYCAACWRNAHLDPGVWDDCTQEVCCRLLEKARAGTIDLNRVLAEDTAERRELVRAIDLVRKRVQRGKVHQAIDARSGIEPIDPGGDVRARVELADLLEQARRAVLSPRQDLIIDLWIAGHSVVEIASELGISPERVSSDKYRALRKLEAHLAASPALVPDPTADAVDAPHPRTQTA